MSEETNAIWILVLIMFLVSMGVLVYSIDSNQAIELAKIQAGCKP